MDLYTLMDIGLISFLVLAFLSGAAPGPGNIYVVSYSLRYGSDAGLCSTCGLTIGCAIAALVAALGISSVLEAYPNAIVSIQIVGGIYIVYLSSKMWPREPTSGTSASSLSKESNSTLFKNGVITSLLNPIDIIFFIVIVPSFIPTHLNGHAYQLHFFVLALFYVTIVYFVKFVLSVFAGFSKELLFSSKGNFVSYLSAALLCLVGLFLIGRSSMELLS